MSAGALAFLGLSWTFVLGLVGWSLSRILRAATPLDPDGIGPARPPAAGAAVPPHGAAP
jgi:hypothetical protein